MQSQRDLDGPLPQDLYGDSRYVSLSAPGGVELSLVRPAAARDLKISSRARALFENLEKVGEL